MDQKKQAPYGSWDSPIKSSMIASEIVTFEQIALDRDDIYWIEMRPSEGGRCVIVKSSSDNKLTDITPFPFSARTLVHEYGGGAFTVYDGTIYFSNFIDQRIYRQDPNSDPIPITAEGKFRYADFIIEKKRRRIICVREDHSIAGREPANTLTSISICGDQDSQILLSGKDFYSSPRLSPDEARLAWISWDHPNMPWDGTELWVAEFANNGSIKKAKRIAGGINESIFQPEWSPDGFLYFISDRNGWWNLFRWHDDEIEPLLEMDAEFGRPQWVFGESTYSFVSDNHIVCTYAKDGIWHLADIFVAKCNINRIEIPYNDIEHVHATSDFIVFIGGSPTEHASVVRLNYPSRHIEILRQSVDITIDPKYISIPQPIKFPTEHAQNAYAFYYSAKNEDFVGPNDQRPPLLVACHGGPTSAAQTTLNLMIQYWTSRGLAVLSVNYGGSTGYGREYRERLNGQWGVVDIDDCINGALYLVKNDEVDGKRLVIRGGSAGGYTVLGALTFRNVFKAGASYYGISDLEKLAKETHKFESHYLDRLIGPYPERRDLYRKRSPINYVSNLSCPVIFFQGLEDKVVPPNQSKIMFEALRSKDLPVSYLAFQGEQHGFHRAENIKRALDAELYFYSRVFDFELAEPIDPIIIYNMREG